MEEFCRICSRADDFRSFVLTTVSQATDVKIDDMLIYCTQLEISPNDGLPKRICADCLTVLNASYAFRKLCYRSDEEFRQLIKNSSPESEFEFIPAELDQKIEFEDHKSEPIQECRSEISIKDEVIELEDFCDTTVNASAIEDVVVPNETTIGDTLDAPSVHLNDTDNQPMETSPNPVYKYICKECDYTSLVHYNFRRHQKIQKHSAFDEVLTEKSAKNKQELKKEKSGGRQNIYKCVDCKFQTHCHLNFKRHQKVWKHSNVTTLDSVISEASPKKFDCPHCGQTRASYYSLKSHMKKTCVPLKESKQFEDEPEAQSDSSERDEQVEQAATEESYKKRSVSFPEAISTKSEVQPFMFKCEFCNYSSAKNGNLIKHHAAMCRDSTYLDETQTPDKFFGDNIKKIISDSSVIEELLNKTGQPLFPKKYIFANHDTTSTCMPPVKLINFVTEYENCLLVTMRGVRCCGCSIFFENSLTLAEHCKQAHPRWNTWLLKDGLSCDDCKIIFYRHDSQDYHNMVKKSDRLFVCTLCEKVIVSYTAWFSHYSKHAVENAMRWKQPEKNRYSCKTCGSLLLTESSLKMHRYNGCQEIQSKPIGDNKKRWLLPFQCDFCNYSCIRKFSLQQHHLLRCKHNIYVNENTIPNVMLEGNPKRIITELTEIMKLRFKSGECYLRSLYFQPTTKKSSTDRALHINPPQS
ncbi:zinc finger protein 260-like isoform X2 [Toxorhynchites rutilus septentrionalis]|uniref:zinc finger protein 260-like isoform X2 n=1 Tax=Toxorhynchites rutilus septentrionalis TaxID=329112 RepID=UPI002478F327|nr:zinc finger protein 260-like isoform X2 [Toxorhynchites rutilus septentrionalis]